MATVGVKPTYGRTVFPAEIKSLSEDDTGDPWRSKALDNLGADLYEALTGPAMRKAIASLPTIKIAEFDD